MNAPAFPTPDATGLPAEWCVFALHPVTAAGRCACSNPTCADIGKHPAVRWSKLRPGEKVLRGGCGAGVATGKRSGDLVVLDLDCKDGKNGWAELLRIAGAHGGIPPTLAVATPTGGAHLYYRAAGIKNSAGAIAPGIDVRGDGGFVVLPGSQHKNGGIYQWANNLPIANMPAWLSRLVRDAGKRGNRTANRASAALAKLDALCAELAAAPAGERNDTLNRAAFTAGGLGIDRATAEARLTAAASACGHDGDTSATLASGYEAGATRPVIEVGALHEGVDEAVAALAADDTLYQRDGRLVRIVRIKASEAESEGVPEGTPIIREVTIAWLRARLSAVARFQRFDAKTGEWKNCDPPDKVVSAVLEHGEWPGVRPLVGISETPIVRSDGSIATTAGYDAASGFVFAPAVTFPCLPERPTWEQARAALLELCDPWINFPFVSDADRVVPIAALLTMLARSAIRGAVPGFAVDSSTRGSGKTKIADAIAIIATGRDAPKMTWPTKDDELEKVLGAYALKGARLVMFDNIPQDARFGGAPLDKVLTAGDRVELRVLGKSELPVLSWRAVVIATGNNLEIVGDTSRRVLVCRIEPKEESPELRTGFLHDPLEAWCHTQRARLVAAGLVVLAAYIAAGRPNMGIRAGSFEEWGALVPSAIKWAAGIDVMQCWPTIGGAEDDTKSAFRTFYELFSRFFPNGATVADLLARLYGGPSATQPPDARQQFALLELRQAVETICPPDDVGRPPDAKALGHALRTSRGRALGSKRLEREPHKGRAATWRVVG